MSPLHIIQITIIAITAAYFIADIWSQGETEVFVIPYYIVQIILIYWMFKLDPAINF
ncbi:hypothetical protein [Lactobacillus sp. 3B(2020)]|uniref:hypothetical protein n=1 Tax=Lactobacillus sp. 3B(2020) TaxID=2695882 RepID=UPI0015DF1863|nr:hypothetical protein [Lactobacillus sp. 3B(2020)]QLL70254.1 hypothetical protein GTO83_06745 [Lactobacillus sp. 3B(2020)]